MHLLLFSRLLAACLIFFRPGRCYRSSARDEVNILGLNIHTNKYESIWIDSMNTAIYYFVGTASADGRTITQECSYDDPGEGPQRLAQCDEDRR